VRPDQLKFNNGPLGMTFEYILSGDGRSGFFFVKTVTPGGQCQRPPVVPATGQRQEPVRVGDRYRLTALS
jgi:hypothetical protein